MALYLSTRRFVDLFVHTFFPAHFDIERKVFGLLRENLLTGILKLHFSCPGFFRTFSPENCICFLLFLGFDYELFVVLAKDSRKVP